MEYKIISTGSKGNAVVVDGRILIDCGVPFRRLESVCRDLDTHPQRPLPAKDAGSAGRRAPVTSVLCLPVAWA